MTSKSSIVEIPGPVALPNEFVHVVHVVGAWLARLCDFHVLIHSGLLELGTHGPQGTHCPQGTP